jgi:acyl-CoA synthetase (AMP-forming)/AMP-acid ligase II
VRIPSQIYESEDPVAPGVIRAGGEFELQEDPFGTGPIFKGHPRTLSALYHGAVGYRERPLTREEGRELTYAEAWRQAAALAWTLKARFGVRPGDRVALVAGNSAEWIVAFIAITSVRAIAVLVNSRGAAEELARALRLTDCKAGVVDAVRAALLADGRPIPGRWIGIDGEPEPLGGISFASALAAAPADAAIENDALPTDGAAALFTSGTTGFPKAALLTHGALAHMVSLVRLVSAIGDAQYAQDIGPPPLVPSPPVVLASPLFHISGLMPVLRAIHFGSPLLLVRKWNVDTVLELIERHGVDRLGLVVTMIWDLLRSPRATEDVLGRLRFLVMGGMQMSEPMIRELTARLPKCQFANGYGSTETTGMGVRIAGAPFVANPVSCGWVLPSMQMRIEREDGGDARVGEVGEVLLRGACLFKEYLSDPQATREAFRGGWYRSGDLGFVDERHRLHLVDRKKNMVISGGENIYCAEVERVLGEHEDVAEVIAFGQPDARLGERLVAVVVPKPGRPFSADALKAYASGRLAIYKVPREIFPREQPLPRTDSGKLSRADPNRLIPRSQTTSALA